jgi:hypothetical protein
MDMAAAAEGASRAPVDQAILNVSMPLPWRARRCLRSGTSHVGSCDNGFLTFAALFPSAGILYPLRSGSEGLLTTYLDI